MYKVKNQDYIQDSLHITTLISKRELKISICVASETAAFKNHSMATTEATLVKSLTFDIDFWSI